MANQNGATFSF